MKENKPELLLSLDTVLRLATSIKHSHGAP